MKKSLLPFFVTNFEFPAHTSPTIAADDQNKNGSKDFSNTVVIYTAIAVRKTWVLHKPIKNRPTLAYKNIVRKCYEDMFFITNMQFNNPTSMPQT